MERKGALGAASAPAPHFCRLPVDIPREEAYLPWYAQRNGLHLATAAPAAEMDRFRVGDVGKQPQGEILFDHEERPKQLARETAELGADRRGAGRLLRLEGQE